MPSRDRDPVPAQSELLNRVPRTLAPISLGLEDLGRANEEELTTSHLPESRRRWIQANKDANLEHIERRLREVESPYASHESHMLYLKLAKRLEILRAEMALLARGSVALVAESTIAPEGYKHIEEFCFVNNTATLVNGRKVYNARLLYRLDLNEFSALDAIEREMHSVETQSRWDACYQFNSLPDGERSRRFEEYSVCAAEHLKLRDTIDHLDLAGDHASARSLMPQLAELRTQMDRLVAPGIIVNPRTKLAHPSNAP